MGEMGDPDRDVELKKSITKLNKDTKRNLKYTGDMKKIAKQLYLIDDMKITRKTKNQIAEILRK